MSKMIKAAIRELNPIIAAEGITEDKTFSNYLALYYCIKGLVVDGEVRYPSINNALSAFDLKNDSTEERGPIEYRQSTNVNLRSRFLVEDITTGEKIECNKLELAEITGMQIAMICKYTIENRIYKNRWKIYRLNLETGNTKYIKLTNLETKEVREIKSIRETAKLFGVSESTISNVLKKGIDYKGYKIEYAD